MLKNIFAASLISLSLLATSANAYSVVTYKRVSGTLASVDTQNSTITLTTEDGISKTFPMDVDAKVVVKSGRAYSLAQLESGLPVVLKQRFLTPLDREVKGTIMSINKANHSLKIFDKTTNEMLEVKFDEKVEISGDEVSSFKDLRVGHEFLARYSFN
jgi:hypothetical protein